MRLYMFLYKVFRPRLASHLNVLIYGFACLQGGLARLQGEPHNHCIGSFPACRSVFKMENKMPSSKTIYTTTALATEHPALADLDLKHGNYKALGESPLGKALCEVMRSEAAVLSLVASQIAAPSRP